MFLTLVFCVAISVVSCTKDQPEGCPFPTGPYVPPECGENEYFEICSFKCPPQTCSNLWCEEPCDPGDGCCRNECRCKDGYLRDEDGNCILEDKCEKPDCIPTCAEPNPQNCNGKNACEKGYVLSEKGGKCIKVEDCPQDLGCNGDENAVIRSCPPPCPSTCSSPNEIPCRKACLEIGCACKAGYILTENNGQCIKPDECIGGNPCGKNGTFVSCRVECPDSYCPEDDSRSIIACDPPYPCPSGCRCKLGYRRTNTYDRQCILAEDCPPVDCTRPNEEFCSCPSACLAEDCADVDNQPSVCATLIHNCGPKCICEEGYFRNSSDICIPAADCPGQC